MEKISALQTGNFKSLDSNSNSASGDKLLRFSEVEVIFKVIPFQVLKFMILYSESCYNSFKISFSHTVSALWKAMPLLVAVMVPELLTHITYQTLLLTQCQLLGSLLVI